MIISKRSVNSTGESAPCCMRCDNSLIVNQCKGVSVMRVISTMSAALRLRRLYGVYPRPCDICLQANDRTLLPQNDTML
jgi:hypothetical protein